MSSRFVSGGTIDAATGDAVDLSKVKEETTTSAPPPTARQAEWAAVEKELEAERQRRAEARKALGSGTQEKSLFDVLQANKAAKQAAFEEAHKLKNQFRALDEDEIEFLEGVEEDARREAARVAAETAAGLDAFRAAQTGKPSRGAGDKKDGESDDDNDDDPAVEKLVDDSAWAVGRKRKRRGDKSDKAGAFPNLKRKGSSAAEKKEKDEPEAKKTEAAASTPSTTKETARTQAVKPAPAAAPSAAPKAKPALGLVSYGSDDDDDEDSD